MENNKLNLVLEVYIFVHWRGQVRFRAYVNDGIFSYVKSDRDFDHKINVMSRRSISRISTTKELEYFWEDDVPRRKLLIQTFEDMIRNLINPLQYLDQMYSEEIKINADIAEFYIFPIGPTKSVKKEAK